MEADLLRQIQDLREELTLGTSGRLDPQLYMSPRVLRARRKELKKSDSLQAVAAKRQREEREHRLRRSSGANSASNSPTATAKRDVVSGLDRSDEKLLLTRSGERKREQEEAEEKRRQKELLEAQEREKRKQEEERAKQEAEERARLEAQAEEQRAIQEAEEYARREEEERLQLEQQQMQEEEERQQQQQREEDLRNIQQQAAAMEKDFLGEDMDEVGRFMMQDPVGEYALYDVEQDMKEEDVLQFLNDSTPRGSRGGSVSDYSTPVTKRTSQTVGANGTSSSNANGGSVPASGAVSAPGLRHVSSSEFSNPSLSMSNPTLSPSKKVLALDGDGWVLEVPSLGVTMQQIDTAYLNFDSRRAGWLERKVAEEKPIVFFLVTNQGNGKTTNANNNANNDNNNNDNNNNQLGGMYGRINGNGVVEKRFRDLTVACTLEKKQNGRKEMIACLKRDEGDDEIVEVDYETLKTRSRHARRRSELFRVGLQPILDPDGSLNLEISRVPRELESRALEELLRQENKRATRQCRFGVLRQKYGQTTESEFFSNGMSDEFERFMSLLGGRVALRGFSGFRGGLSEDCAEHSYYRKLGPLEIMWHVAPMLNGEDGDFIGRRRFIAYDTVLIVFQDSACNRPFPAGVISSKYVHVVIVVRPLGKKNKYKIAVQRRENVDVFGPPIPETATFTSEDALSDFLIAKCVWGESAVLESNSFAPLLSSVRKRQFKEFHKSYRSLSPTQSSQWGSPPGSTTSVDSGSSSPLSQSSSGSLLRKSLPRLSMRGGSDKVKKNSE